jgi:predicted enzyme related to lactoylglutathione lyase
MVAGFGSDKVLEMMPKVDGVLETALYVEDMPRAVQFYEDLFGFEKLVADQRFCAFNVAGRQVLLLFQKGTTEIPTT